MKTILRGMCAGLIILNVTPGVYAKDLAGPKKRIAVTSFKDKSNHTYHYWASVGDGMSEMLATALNQTGKFILVERNQLESVKEEQALASGGAVQAATGARSGQLIGAAYIVTGAVTEFGIKNSKFGAGNLGRLLPIGGDASLQMETARVALDLRFVDTTTGQVIATEQAVGTKTSRKVQSDIDKLPSIQFGKEGFDETVIGQATREAIEKAVALVEKHLEKSPWYGRVVKVEGSSIYINTGEEDQRKIGDSFEAIRVGETMVDPDTGEALGAERTKVGHLHIVQLMGKRLAKAEATETFDAKPGDVIE